LLYGVAGEGRLNPGTPRVRVAAIAAAAVLLVVAVVVVVSRRGESGGTAQVGGTTLPAATAPSTTVAAPTPPTRLAPSTTTPRPTTTAAGARATTTTAPRATTTGPQTAPPTTASGGALPACTATFFRSSVTSDRATYRNGETVQVSARFENVSGRACTYSSTNATSQVLKPDGTPFTPARTLESANDQNVPFEPGTSQTFGSSWEIAVCAPEGTCSPGRYAMVVDVAPFGGGRVSFDVTAP
jgi:hypothetical protein